MNAEGETACCVTLPYAATLSTLPISCHCKIVCSDGLPTTTKRYLLLHSLHKVSRLCREAAAILDAFAGLEAATDTADAQELQSALATAAAVDAPFVP